MAKQSADQVGDWNGQSGERWVANQEVRGYMGAFPCAHVCLVSDSCFSGDLLDATRSADIGIDQEYYARAWELRSREVLTSGASEPVA